jgi:hypothetical protein
MICLVMRRRLLALVLSIPLVASGAAGVMLHVCHSMGGLVVGDCNCEKQAQHGDHAGHRAAAHKAASKLQKQPCCTVELSSTSQLVATQEVSWQQVDEATVALVGATDGGIASSRLACDPALLRERAPPNIHGPPIFIRHCSFLN